MMMIIPYHTLQHYRCQTIQHLCHVLQGKAIETTSLLFILYFHLEFHRGIHLHGLNFTSHCPSATNISIHTLVTSFQCTWPMLVSLLAGLLSLRNNPTVSLLSNTQSDTLATWQGDPCLGAFANHKHVIQPVIMTGDCVNIKHSQDKAINSLQVLRNFAPITQQIIDLTPKVAAMIYPFKYSTHILPMFALSK